MPRFSSGLRYGTGLSELDAPRAATEYLWLRRSGSIGFGRLAADVWALVLGADDVVDFERLVDLVEPFGPVRRAAPAALIERKLQLAQQARRLFARRDMAEIRAGAERRLIEVVERGETARKELAIDHALGKAIDRAEPEPERQFLQPVGDELLVARPEHRQAITDHDPVGRCTVELAALAPCAAHHLGIMALAGHRIGGGIDGPQHIEIEEAVVDRRDQRVGHRMRKAHQIAVGSRRIDHDEVERPFDDADGIHELLELGVLVLRDLHGLAELDAAMDRQFERKTGAARPDAAIADITGEALLPAIEIDGGDALTSFHQGNGDVQRGGRFARTALLVAQHDDVSRA